MQWLRPSSALVGGDDGQRRSKNSAQANSQRQPSELRSIHQPSAARLVCGASHAIQPPQFSHSTTMKPAPSAPQRNDLLLLASLYFAELGLLFIALSIARKDERPFSTWILSTPGIAFLMALVLSLVTLVWIGRQYARSRRSGSRRFGFIVAMNVVTLALILIPVEIGLRLFSRDAADAPSFLYTLLLPRSWERAVTHRSHSLDKASGGLSYLVYDETLGWTVGPNRRGADGLYLSSAEGIRAASQGAVLHGPKDRLRVALVGDSYVFAERVSFEDSWGHQLERDSGVTLQVLNFGVGGYGVDQSYLRFKKDVLAWKPDVAILGFPFSDLQRSLTVYPLISSPHWNMPFSKPRFVLNNGELRTLNVPTIPPQTLFAMGSLSDLPFLEYDYGYRKDQWEGDITDLSYVKRWLFSYFARAPQPSDVELIQVNAAILRAFHQLANEHDIIPIIAYFPGRGETMRLMRGEETEVRSFWNA